MSCISSNSGGSSSAPPEKRRDAASCLRALLVLPSEGGVAPSTRLPRICRRRAHLGLIQFSAYLLPLAAQISHPGALLFAHNFFLALNARPRRNCNLSPVCFVHCLFYLNFFCDNDFQLRAALRGEMRRAAVVSGVSAQGEAFQVPEKM